MTQEATIAGQPVQAEGLDGVVADWSGDKQAFPVPLGQGHDVDLPAQRHLHLQLLPDRLT